MKNLGLPLSSEDLDQVAGDFLEDFRLRNTRPLSPDLIALFVDGKYVEVRDGDQLRPATIYVAVGLGRDGTKRILACMVRPGRENLDDWSIAIQFLEAGRWQNPAAGVRAALDQLNAMFERRFEHDS